MPETNEISRLLKDRSGIRLDIGCGSNRQHGFVGMDVRPLDGVDIVHDVTRFPWPLPDECVTMALASHLVEHIPPFAPDSRLLNLIKLLREKEVLSEKEVDEHIGTLEPKPMFIAFMDEVWRILKSDGEFWVSCPHGYSPGFLQDPTHINEINENSWAYFDPARADGILYNIYRPKPWFVKQIRWSPDTNIEVVLRKRAPNGKADS